MADEFPQQSSSESVFRVLSPPQPVDLVAILLLVRSNEVPSLCAVFFTSPLRFAHYRPHHGPTSVPVPERVPNAFVL